MKNVGKKTVWVIMVLALFVLCSFSETSCVSRKNRQTAEPWKIKFDSQKWKNTKLYFFEDETRIRMLDDLLTNYKLIGASREEILELLGPESDPTYFKGWNLRYWLGPERGIPIDSMWLLLRLENNKVVEYKIATD